MLHRILLADDHDMIRKGLKLSIKEFSGIKDIAEVASCYDLMKEISAKRYTHLILDLGLADGNALCIIPDIRKACPDLRILIFSMQPPSVYGKSIEKLGVYHYCSKSTSEEDMIRYLRSFLQNERFSIPHASEVPENPFSKLTLKEQVILTYLLMGWRTKEIAGKLNLKSSTISTFKNQILEKTQTTNLKELIELATLYNVQ